MFYALLSLLFVGTVEAAEISTVAGVKATGYLGLGDKNALAYKPLSADDDELPESFDWRTIDGVMTSVKDQGNCGSCVSFATMGMLEAAQAIFGDKANLNLSEQNMLDCRSGDAFGCNGAYLSAAAFTLNGVSSEMDYPYRGRRERCKALDKVAKSSQVFLLGEPNRKPTRQELKKALIEYGPFMVSAYAGGSGWSGKTGKVTSCRRTSSTNHAILLVGYNKDGWIFKNSWGKTWGDQGYSWIGYGCDGFGTEAAALVVD